MKILRQGIALAVVGAGFAAVPAATTVASAAAAPDTRPLITQMRAEADGGVAVSDERSTGKLSFIRATGRTGDLLPGEAGSTRSAAVAKARAYVDSYAEAFGAPSSQVEQEGVSAGRFGATVVTYTQKYQGVPVFGSMLKAHLDAEGDLTAVNGELVPVKGLDTDAALSEAEAGQAAVGLVKAQPPTGDSGKADTSGVKPTATDLVVYRTGLTKGVAGGESKLVYAVEVSNEANVRDMVFLDADNGKVVNRYTLVDDVNGPDRRLFEADANRNLTLVWSEGDPFPAALNSQQQNLVLTSGESYWLYANAFGRDSYDGDGARMNTINNDPAIACPNANWNGVTTNYCDGVTSDDVVSHEWTHAYTEYTHGLIYQWQPGALNESYSDIFGETLDLVNGRDDAGEGAIDEPRPVGQCSTHSPASPLLTINSPSDIAKDCLTGGASFGEQLDGTGITGDVVAATDAVEDGGTATDGCSPYDEDVTGQVVLVDRGLCAFTDKAQVATDAGAAALIIGNRDDAPIGMSGDDPSLVTTVSIGLGDRELIRGALADGQDVNVTMKDASGDRVDSYRWLIGEKATAFGGAIRDMWSPTCYGDPGKVSDAEYKCSTDDQGGVHSNSGVPNHGYALLVDGGTFNGTTVEGIGIDKALNIYYTAMTEYQTPSSDFVDHANSLEASCSDLVGKQIKEISTAPNDSVVAYAQDRITTGDCAQVAAMTQAVELRVDPTEECQFQPLLQPGAPSACGEGFTDTQVFGDDFEITADNATGLDNWTLSGENPYDGPTFPWEATRDYNGEHSSRVAYGPDPDAGDCSGSDTDASSVDYMTSPTITLPDDGVGQRMTFEHYVATEVGYDGGNVQVAVNGGDFAPIDPEAYVFNGPGQLATEAEGNTNPLEGQSGFTGTDGGSVFGSWGTSIVDLAAAGANPGDEVAVRFAMGRDGCGGLDGWYVDNVAVVVCEESGTPPAGAAATETTALRALPLKPRTKRPFAVRVKVTSADATPEGQVQLRFKGRTIGTDTLNTKGVALIGSTRKFAKPGVRSFGAKYLGSPDFEGSFDRLRVRIVRR